MNCPLAAAAVKGAGVASDNTRISWQLDCISRGLESGVEGDVAAARAAVQELQSLLKTCSGLEQRANRKGGLQYKAIFMLDAVMLADNLRGIHAQEADLMETVVKQLPGLTSVSTHFLDLESCAHVARPMSCTQRLRQNQNLGKSCNLQGR